MIPTVTQYLTQIRDRIMNDALTVIFRALADRYASTVLATTTLLITAASATTAKTGATATLLQANGATLSLVASTVLTPFAGTTLINTFNVYVFYCNNAGVISAGMGTAATTLGGVVWPNTPPGQCILGGFTVNPTAGSFIGNTTALDAVSTNVNYFSPTGAYDPSVIVGAAY